MRKGGRERRQGRCDFRARSAWCPMRKTCPRLLVLRRPLPKATGAKCGCPMEAGKGKDRFSPGTSGRSPVILAQGGVPDF